MLRKNTHAELTELQSTLVTQTLSSPTGSQAVQTGLSDSNKTKYGTFSPHVCQLPRQLCLTVKLLTNYSQIKLENYAKQVFYCNFTAKIVYRGPVCVCNTLFTPCGNNSSRSLSFWNKSSSVRLHLTTKSFFYCSRDAAVRNREHEMEEPPPSE